MSHFCRIFEKSIVFKIVCCYTDDMNTPIIPPAASKPFDVTVFDTRLKVFRVTNAFGIKKRSDLEAEGALVTVHSHFTYEAFFVTDGKLDLTIGEKNQTYERKALIIPPRIKHFSVPSDAGSYSLLFSFEQQPDSRWQKLLDAHLEQGVCALDITEDMDFSVKRMASKSLLSDPVSEQETGIFAALLFCEIFSQLLPQEVSVQLEEKGNAKHIYAIEAYINRGISRRITLAEVAAYMSLSTRQVSRIIRKEYGCTLSQLVTDKKLSAAEVLIRKGDLPIDQIAAQSGLGAPNYFYALFKKRYGLSPLQYRKLYADLNK